MNFAYGQYSELWATTFIGGSNNAGFIFKMDGDGGNYQIVHEFDGAEGGSNCYAGLIEGQNGLFYGMTGSGGRYDNGVIFSYNRAYNTFNIEYDFENEVRPWGRLTQASNGKLYGYSSEGLGEIFEFDPTTKQLSVVHSFSSSPGQFVLSEGYLIQASSNHLWGTTLGGGNTNGGILFEFNIETHDFVVKHHFTHATGTSPAQALLRGSNGKLYGTTYSGGNNSRGVLFEYDLTSDTYTDKVHLENPTSNFNIGLTEASNGLIYATSSIGGSISEGALLEYNISTNTLEVLYSFTPAVGNIPASALLEAYNGKLYGLTRYGGTGEGLGMVYEFDITGNSLALAQSLNDGFPLNSQLIEVGERTITSITLDSPADVIDTDNSTMQFTTTITPTEAADQPLVWSVSDESLASISSDGLLTAKANGSVIVTATANFGLGLSDNKEITITNQDNVPPAILVESITISSPSDEINTVEGTLPLNVAITPTNATNQSVSWHSSDESIATISPGGLVTAHSDGSVIITALANDGSAAFAVKPIEIFFKITSIEVISPANTITSDKGTMAMGVTILPVEASEPDFNWQVSDGSLAYVRDDGQLFSLDNGVVTIWAEATDGSGVAGSKDITISGQTAPVLVTGIVISSASDEITTANGTMQMTATISPVNASIQSVYWYVGDTTLVSISSTGLLTAKSNGDVYVFARSNDGSSILAVRQIKIRNQDSGPQGANSLVINSSQDFIDSKNGTLQLSIVTDPEAAANYSLFWGVSNPAIATIDNNGLLTAVSDGAVTVSANIINFDNSVVGNTKTITITNQSAPIIEVTDIVIAGPATEITDDDGTLQLTATVSPTNATDKSVSWSISDMSIASIDNTGKVSALVNGTVIVTATALGGTGIEDTFAVTISNQTDEIPVSSIIITTTQDHISDLGQSLSLNTQILPANATDQSLTWTSSNPNVATISTSGVVTSVNFGEVIITAEANDGSAVSVAQQIEVISSSNFIPVTSITLSASSNTINSFGGTLVISPTISPADATDQSLIWTSSDNSVATVSQSGVVSAITNGQTIIMAMTNDGSGATAEFTVDVTVGATSVLVSSIVITASKTVIDMSENNLFLSTQVSPENATDKSLEWVSSNITVAEVNSSGELTLKSPGEVTITSTARDGSGISANIDITVTNTVITALDKPDSPIDFIYPNPFERVIHIEFQDEKLPKLILLYDLKGKLLDRIKPNGKNIDLGNLESGFYYISILAESGETKTVKLIKR